LPLKLEGNFPKPPSADERKKAIEEQADPCQTRDTKVQDSNPGCATVSIERHGCNQSSAQPGNVVVIECPDLLQELVSRQGRDLMTQRNAVSIESSRPLA
jgi:hypothetical protein